MRLDLSESNGNSGMFFDFKAKNQANGTNSNNNNSNNINLQFQRCASAPVSRQDPLVLRELVGMLKNTVTVSPSGFGLALAPPKITNLETKNGNISLPKPSVATAPITPPSPKAPVASEKPTIGGGAFKKVARKNSD